MKFRLWIESKQFTGINDRDVTWWANYSSNHIFKSVEDARQWVFDRRQHHDRGSHVAMFGGVDGPEYNRQFADAIPVYQSGKSWKIGKRIRQDNRLRLGQLKIKMPDITTIHTIAQANGESDYKIHKVKNIPVRYTIPDNDSQYNGDKEVAYIKELAARIKENGWIEPVVYHYTEMWIIEGQHRARAMRVLGFNMVPGIGIEYFDES